MFLGCRLALMSHCIIWKSSRRKVVKVKIATEESMKNEE
jgi:hypothetical protein